MSRHYLSRIIGAALAACFILIACMPSSAQRSSTYAETRELLQGLNLENDSNGNLAKLFRIGDERIKDLIQALSDPNEAVKQNAQLIIRYLGNYEGMNALIESFKGKKSFTIYGAIPLPLQAWDYEIVNSYFINKPQQFDQLAKLYLYALALDDSPEAVALLPKMLETAKAAGAQIPITDPLISKRINSTFNEDGDLARATLRASFFISPQDQRSASAKVINFNHNNTKALIEIYINRGVLSEELYHVIVIKSDHQWKLFSINLVSMS